MAGREEGADDEAGFPTAVDEDEAAIVVLGELLVVSVGNSGSNVNNCTL